MGNLGPLALETVAGEKGWGRVGVSRFPFGEWGSWVYGSGDRAQRLGLGCGL